MRFALQKKTEQKSKSSLFLMELIISICFFALASAVCIRLFVQAHFLSRDTITLNRAVSECQNLAEIYCGCDGSELEAVYLMQCEYESLTETGNGIYTLDLPECRIVLDFKNPLPQPGGGVMNDLVVSAYDKQDKLLFALNTFDYAVASQLAAEEAGGAYEE